MNTKTIQSSYLEIILGPMFSGKTTRLLEIYKKCIFCNITVSIINHALDTRYDNVMLSNHDNVKAPCIFVEKLNDLINNMQVINSTVILINEGQFFSDLYDFVIQMLDKNKKIYVCGLDGDFERKKFGNILDIIPLCDNVYKLTSLCSLCKDGTRGIFSLRLTNEKEQTVVGSDNYMPVCRNCYIDKNK